MPKPQAPTPSATVKRGSDVLEKLSKKEVATLRRSLRSGASGSSTNPKLGRKHFRYVCISDTHTGHKKVDLALWEKIGNYIEWFKPDFVIHPGDHLEGMSGRPGHVYELSEIGFSAQIERHAELLNAAIPRRLPIYGIQGNHDFWYEQKGDMGVSVGKTLGLFVPNYVNLGDWEGEVVQDGIRIRLIHAADGTAHASSWKLEKRIDSLDGGDKPHILHSGHYHKALYLFRRNVHGFESGTICRQTGFMRGKNLPAHVGFWGSEVWHDGNGVDRLTPTFIPGY